MSKGATIDDWELAPLADIVYVRGKDRYRGTPIFIRIFWLCNGRVGIVETNEYKRIASNTTSWKLGKPHNPPWRHQ